MRSGFDRGWLLLPDDRKAGTITAHSAPRCKRARRISATKQRWQNWLEGSQTFQSSRIRVGNRGNTSLCRERTDCRRGNTQVPKNDAVNEWQLGVLSCFAGAAPQPHDEGHDAGFQTNTPPHNRPPCHSAQPLSSHHPHAETPPPPATAWPMNSAASESQPAADSDAPSAPRSP
jgi:hypothetical protein